VAVQRLRRLTQCLRRRLSIELAVADRETSEIGEATQGGDASHRGTRTRPLHSWRKRHYGKPLGNIRAVSAVGSESESRDVTAAQ